MAPLRRAGDRLGPVLPEVAAATGLDRRHAGLLRHPRFQRLAAAAPDRTGPSRSPSSRREPGSSPWRSAAPRSSSIRRATRWSMSTRSASRCRRRASWAAASSRRWSARGPTEPSPDAIRAVLETPILLTPSVQQGSGPFPKRRSEWIGGEPTGDARHVGGVVLPRDDDGDRAGTDRRGGADRSSKGRSRPTGRLPRCSLRRRRGRSSRPARSATGTSIGAALLAAGDGATSRTVGSDGCGDRTAKRR